MFILENLSSILQSHLVHLWVELECTQNPISSTFRPCLLAPVSMIGTQLEPIRSVGSRA